LDHLIFDDSNLPFDGAQGGELVEPFRISANFIRSGEFRISGLSGLGQIMIKKLEEHLQRDFKSNYVIYWNNLSRLTNMLIISNFSLFFLTELVTRDRYYYTHLSLGFLLIVHIALILPLGLLGRIWFYRLCLLLEFVSIYFFVVSIWYWVVTNIS
jgi:hypothetical protein